jgi:hypothetical protein
MACIMVIFSPGLGSLRFGQLPHAFFVAGNRYAGRINHKGRTLILILPISFTMTCQRGFVCT